MSPAATLLIRAARRMTASLQTETALARLGALGDLAAAAAAKEHALREFAAACAARGRTPPATDPERAELRQVLAAADENALILEAVSSTLQDLTMKIRAAASTVADPGTYSPPGRPARHDRHVLAASYNAMV